MTTTQLTDVQALTLDQQVRKALAGELDDQILVDLVTKNAPELDQILLEDEVNALAALSNAAAERLEAAKKAADATVVQEAEEVAPEADPYKEFREKVADDFQARGYSEAAQALRDFVPGADCETLAWIAEVLKRDIAESGVYGKYEKLAWKVHYLAKAGAGIPDDDVVEAVEKLEENEPVFAEQLRNASKAVAKEDQAELEEFNASVDDLLKDRQPPAIFTAIVKMVKQVTAVLLGIYVGHVNDADDALQEERFQDAYDSLSAARKIEFGHCGLKTIERMYLAGELPDCVREWFDKELKSAMDAETAAGKRAFVLFNSLTRPLYEELKVKQPPRQSFRPGVMRPGKTARDRANNPVGEALRRKRQEERAAACKSMKGSNPGVEKHGHKKSR